ncbi:HNH endonuclease [Halomarina pelagica]|uniref:HNH endonuclease n=1 Tax=Halomarina pelagica TaxID=2961599 RepID=UPI0020C47FEC|nr:HNH endonuclease [Halomarina sp. BND7]
MDELTPSDIIHGTITRISNSGNGILDYGSGEITIGPVNPDAVGMAVDAVVYDENHALCLTAGARTEYYDNTMRAQTGQLVDNPPEGCPGIGDTVEATIEGRNSAGHGPATYRGFPVRVQNIPEDTRPGETIPVKIVRVEPSRLVATGLVSLSLRNRLPEIGETFSAPVSRRTQSGNGLIESFIGHSLNIGPVRDSALGEQIEAVLLDDQFAYCLSTDLVSDNYQEAMESRVTDEALARSAKLQDHLGTGGEPMSRSSSRILRPVQRRSSTFSKRVREAYNHACAVCGQRWQDESGYFEVEAAHIYPVSGVDDDDSLEGGPDAVQNGLALCRTHHWAFDHGWFTIDDDYTICVRDDPSLDGYEAIAPYEGEQLHLPADRSQWPARHYLTFHRDHVWTG